MDTVQVLTIDIPVKSRHFMNNPNDISSFLLKNVKDYLIKNGNYFANGVVYPETIEILHWNYGIKRGSILGDEMIFTTTIRALFRLYQINQVYIGRIVSVDNNYAIINHENKYDIKTLFITTENEEQNNDRFITQYLKNNNRESLIGKTVEFTVLFMDSMFNGKNILIIAEINKIIDNYTKIYNCNCSSFTEPQYQHIDVNDNIDINSIIPYYISVLDEDDRSKLYTVIENPDLNNINIFNDMKYSNSLIIELELSKDVTNPFNEDYYKTICKYFTSVTMYYNWAYPIKDKYKLYVVCSFYVNQQ